MSPSRGSGLAGAPLPAGLWKGRTRPLAETAHLSTGFESLDGWLPGRGWPLGAVTEILCEAEGIGELSMLLPGLAALGRQARWVVWLDPPYVPYAASLATHGIPLSRTLWVAAGRVEERFWAAEQLLRTRACGAVVMWLPASFDSERMLRRLHLAAESSGAWSVLLRRVHEQGARSGADGTRPRASNARAALRLQVEARDDGLWIRLLKCRGRPPSRTTLYLPWG